MTTHCNTLQHAATHCNILQHAANHCNTLQHTATHCNTLQHRTCSDRGTFDRVYRIGEVESDKLYDCEPDGSCVCLKGFQVCSLSHTHTLNLSYAHTFNLFLFSLSLPLFVSFPLSHTHFQPLSLLSLSSSLCLFPSLAHTLLTSLSSLSLFLSLSLSLTHTHFQPLSLLSLSSSPYFCLSHTHTFNLSLFYLSLPLFVSFSLAQCQLCDCDPSGSCISVWRAFRSALSHTRTHSLSISALIHTYIATCKVMRCIIWKYPFICHMTRLYVTWLVHVWLDSRIRDMFYSSNMMTRNWYRVAKTHRIPYL